MLSFVEQSYSPIALFAIPVAMTIIAFLWRAREWTFIRKWLGASAASAALYVTGSTLIEGPSAFVGLAFIIAMILQMPVSLAVGGVTAALERTRRGHA
jgi:hypothetical protein